MLDELRRLDDLLSRIAHSGVPEARARIAALLATAGDGVVLVITEAERELLAEAVDSHIYWQLSDKHYRRDGFVLEPGSDDPETAATIAACEALREKVSR